jgi:hypothetical protein
MYVQKAAKPPPLNFVGHSGAPKRATERRHNYVSAVTFKVKRGWDAGSWLATLGFWHHDQSAERSKSFFAKPSRRSPCDRVIYTHESRYPLASVILQLKAGVEEIFIVCRQMAALVGLEDNVNADRGRAGPCNRTDNFR